MKQEQAREIAELAFDRWQGVHDVPLQVKIADALHAAYEAERGGPKELEAIAAACEKHARLASIKETARAILAAEATTGEDSIRRRNGFKESMDTISDSALDWAECLESAFERRYGGAK